MPIIEIKSLPFEQGLDIPATVQHLSERFSHKFDIAIEHITIIWNELLPGYHASGGTTVNFQPRNNHPLHVEILVPDINPPENIELILLTVAEELSNSVKVAPDNIFIHLRTARSGHIFDHGEIVEWDRTEEEVGMTKKTQRSGDDRRTDEERRTANVPNVQTEERRTGTERRSGTDRRTNGKS